MDMTYDAYGAGSGDWPGRGTRNVGDGSRRRPGRAGAGRRESDRSAPTRFGRPRWGADEKPLRKRGATAEVL